MWLICTYIDELKQNDRFRTLYSVVSHTYNIHTHTHTNDYLVKVQREREGGVFVFKTKNKQIFFNVSQVYINVYVSVYGALKHP